MLANATMQTDKYYGSDVKIAYRLTQRLLQHESSQQGFNLTATQDVHFTEVSPCAGNTHTHTATQHQTKQSNRSSLQQSKLVYKQTGSVAWWDITYLRGIHHTSFHSPLWHPVTLNSRCFLTESGPRGQRRPVPRHTAALGADPAHGGRHSCSAAPLRGVRKHAGAEHEEDLPESLHHCYSKHRLVLVR